MSQDYDPKKDYSSKASKIILIDFDGVLSDYSQGWRGEETFGEPLEEGVKLLQELWTRGFKPSLYTTRLGGENVLGSRSKVDIERVSTALFSWCNRHGIVDYIHDVLPFKPMAHLHIDDRAIQFKGLCDETLTEVKRFKPWWEV